MPAIMASVWKSPDDKLGLAITNMDNQPLDVDITMDLDEYDVPSNPLAYKFYQFDDPNIVVCNSADRVLQFSLTLSARDAKVYELGISHCTEFKQSDINKDCFVNFLDFAILMKNWFDCTDPDNTDCENIL